jgi:hypothetical protein
MDADEDGRELAGVIAESFEAACREDLRFRVQEPVGFKDFSDQLRENSLRSCPRRSMVAAPS